MACPREKKGVCVRSVRAFTLIELLVVIAIIAILAAMLMPALERARRSAWRTACMGNIHQWHLGLEMFGNSHDGYYPGIVNHGQGPTGCGEYTNTEYPNGQAFMEPYGADLPDYINKKVTLCPGAPPRPYPLMPYGDEGCEWYQALLKASEENWQFRDNGTMGGVYGGITDYAIRVGFGSLHGGIDASGYRDPDPNYYRGHHKSMYYRWSDGFVFTYRQDQADAHTKSILIMDRQRSPAVESFDGGRYELIRANHAGSGGRGAAGCNVLLAAGQVEWMDLLEVWSKSDLSENYYGRNGYAEGGYPQYVSEEFARHWQ
jgi:prepilin-type N-terminal cleavage/methylation domain-containing protein